MSRRVIVDTDAGSDDAFALILLLEDQNTDIVAITCVNGNTTVKNVYINVQRILKLCKRTDIPVYLGASEPFLYSENDQKINYHGEDGFGDLEYEPDGITVKTKQNSKNNEKQNIQLEQNAVEMINKIVSKNTGEISVICLGPLTNIGLAMKVHPKFAEKVKEFYFMGGNYRGIGNATSAAEFNFYVDPEAAYVALHFSKCPIIILPWEPCLDNTISFDWRYKVLGKSSHPTMNLLNAVEKSIYSNKERDWISCDAYLTALFLYPEMVKNSFKCKTSVELQGYHTRAQMVIKHIDKNVEPNATIVTEIDVDLFKSILLKSFNK